MNADATTAQHTPGPWGIEQTDHDLWIGPMRTDGQKIDVIVVRMDRDNDYKPESLAEIDANAALIASAPDLLRERNHLLEANRRLVEACEQVYNADDLKQISFEMVRDALAFAKGQS